jgi:hypothetical protein
VLIYDLGGFLGDFHPYDGAGADRLNAEESVMAFHFGFALLTFAQNLAKIFTWCK